ncbi:hypothetical protein ACFL2V_12865 [Pseudomonadota bacterium]
MKPFSDFAYERLLDLYNNHSHEVGSELKKDDPAKYAKYKSTDCITYALNVISHAFENTGNPAAAKKVWKLGKHGTELAKYLVESHNWKGVYINPDVIHPADGDDEHAFTSHLASKTCKYYKIPLEYKVINYSVTPKTGPEFGTVNRRKGVTPLNTVDIKSLDLVNFGFGVSRGGRHTWLFSAGKVYEVHWDEIGVNLYEASPIRTYQWLSGVIVVPPGQAGILAASAKVSCA